MRGACTPSRGAVCTDGTLTQVDNVLPLSREGPGPLPRASSVLTLQNALSVVLRVGGVSTLVRMCRRYRHLGRSCQCITPSRVSVWGPYPPARSRRGVDTVQGRPHRRGDGVQS